MQRSGPPNFSQREILRKLDRECERHLGLAPDHDIRQKIASLDLYWNEDILAFVQRAVDEIRAHRARCDHAGRYIPPPRALAGDLVVGEAISPLADKARVAVPSDHLIFNMLVSGLIGAGKTHFVRLLLSLLVKVRPDVNIILFDPNNSYADMCSPPLWVSLDWTACRFNRLCAPPGYPYPLWKSEVVDAFCRGELLHSKYLLARRVDELFETVGNPEVDDGASPMPSLFDLRDDLALPKGRPGSKDDSYRSSSLNVLDGRLRSTGSVYDCGRGMELPLTNTRARISTLGLSPVESLQFFITGLLHYAYRRRCVAPALFPPSLHTLVVGEEAQTLLERREGAPIALYQEMLLRSRTLGLGYVFLCQDLARIDPVVFSGITNYLLFAQSSAANKRMAQHILDLDARETGLLSELSLGECFVKFVGHPDWPYPFTARIAP